LGKTPDEFLKLYNPSAGLRLLNKGYRSGEIALMPQMPRLCDIETKYGSALAHKWLEIQLLSLDTIQGSTSFSPEAKIETSQLILSAYGDFNLAELLNFFARYKLGEFTQVTQYYGGLQKILIALRHYRMMRNEDLARLEREEEKQKRDKEREEHDSRCITYDEYLKTR
jgi:hypothetical protein